MTELNFDDQVNSARASEPPENNETSDKKEVGCLAYGIIYFYIAYLGALLVSYSGIAWLARSIVTALGENWPLWLDTAILVAIWVLVGLPLLPLLYFWREGKLARTVRLWSVGALYLLLQTPFRLLPPASVYWWLLAQLLLNGLLFLILVVWLGQTGQLRRPAGPYVPALSIAAVLALPWLLFGALGSGLDMLLSLLAALSFGLVAALLLASFGLPVQSDESELTWSLGPGAHIGGAFLMIMVAGFAYSVLQLVLLFVLALAGWLFMSLLYWGRPDPRQGWLAGGLMLALATAFPLLTFDVAELDVSLEFGLLGMWQWLGIALAAFMLAALIISISTYLGRQGLTAATGRPGRIVMPLLLWGVVWAVWGQWGQTGTHGERLFVILADQADVAAARELTDIENRREFVYRTLVAHGEVTQAELQNSLDTLRIDYTPYYLVNAIEVEGGPLIKLWLNTRPEVDRILASPRLRPLPTEPALSPGEAAAPSGPLWNQQLIEVDRVWVELGVRGEGIVIGQSDSGVEWDHPELRRAYRGGEGDHDYHWFDPWFGTAVPEDWSGHGTHTLGTVLGESVGMAPEATWFGCVNLARNLGNPALYLDCLQFMLAPFPLNGDPWQDGDPALGAHVLNNSWGCPPVEGCDAEALLPAVQALRAAGIFVVASAGNSGPSCGTVDSPLPLYEEVFAVGAIGPDGAITDFSSRGPVSVDGSGRIKPDILAPGAEILSSTPAGTYALNQGTSMAGPHVAGVVALMWSANAALIGDVEKTAQILAETATPYDQSRHGLPDCAAQSRTPNAAVGHGIVNAFAAVVRASCEGELCQR